MFLLFLLAAINAIPFCNTDSDGKTGVLFSDFVSRGPHSFDVLHYDVSMEVFEADSEIVSVVGMHFRSEQESLSSITLDIRGLTVDSVWDSGGDLSFEQGDETVDVDLSTPLNPGDTTTVWLASGGTPIRFSWYKELDGHMSHYSRGMTPSSGRFLFPCWDDIYDKASMDAHITVTDTLYAVSCGELTGVESSGGRLTYHWHHPRDIALYIWAIAISDFIVIEDTTYDWIRYYTYPDMTGQIETIFGKVDRMIDCFESHFCAYPWDNNLGFPFLQTSGYYEHNTIPFTMATESIIAHEISHHWWGNMVTEEDWPEIWLAEGLATYSQAIWEEWEYGPEFYSDFMLELMISYIQCRRTDPIVPASDYWSKTVYKKGACVIHMLRYVLGDGDFFAGLQLYLADNAYGSATTEDLITAFETVSSRELDWFFDPWVYGMAYPEYQFSWTGYQTGEDWGVDLIIEQVQTTETLFAMPIELLIEGEEEDSVFIVWNDTQYQQENLIVPFQPFAVTLDPYHNILRKELYTGIEGPDEPSCPGPGPMPFPNPSSSSVAILWQHHESFTVSLFDLSGRCVLKTAVSAITPTLNVSSLPSGNYRMLVESCTARDAGSLTVIRTD